jgi:hypothetical protein
MKKLYILILLFTPLFLFSQDSVKKDFVLSKGGGFVIPNFNLNQLSGTNNQVLGVQFDSRYELSYSVNLNGGYFLEDYFSIGVQLGYTNNQHDFTYYPSGIKTISKSYTNLMSVVPNIRNYFGKGIFKGFVQTNLGVSFGKGLTRTYSDANDTKLETNEFVFSVAIQPGVAVFVANFVSVELSINLIGYNTKFKNSTFDDGTESKLNTNNINFDVNLLTLNIGIGFYIGTNKENK